MTLGHVVNLTNDELVAQVAHLAGRERGATVALIAHLAEFDARRLFEAAGFSSTFRYCLDVLHLSEDAAFNRIEVARAARRFPALLDMIVDGSLSPTTARMRSRHLTTENHQALLNAASGKSKHEVDVLLAGLFPQPDVPSSIRVLRSTPAVAMSTPAPTPLNADAPKSADDRAGAPASCPSAPAITAERYEIRFTASTETREKLRLAQDLFGHAVPRGDLDAVFGRALSLLIRDLQRKKFASTEHPRASRGQEPDSRNIPATVRRAVVHRDGGACAFMAVSGRRCGERRFLEFNHVKPYAVQGKPTVGNIQLRCRAHNRHEADLFFAPLRRFSHVAAVTRSGTGRAP